MDNYQKFFVEFLEVPLIYYTLYTLKFGNISVELLFEVKKIFALKRQ
jgi:hypothetical protein